MVSLKYVTFDSTYNDGTYNDDTYNVNTYNSSYLKF